MSCPNCPCAQCVASRTSPYRRDELPFTDYGTPGPAPGVDRWTGERVVKTGAGDPECAFERIAREYAARGETMPATWLLYCGCKRCSPTCL